MNLTRTLTLHLADNVDVTIHPVSQSAGHSRAVVVIGIAVPPGRRVELADPVVTLREGPSAPAVALRVERIVKPRTVNEGPDLYSMRPDAVMRGLEQPRGSNDAAATGYGIEIELPRQNPPQLSVTAPPLLIDGHRVDVQTVDFILKTSPHLAGVCQ
jgi:hypothetical protein